jgi:indole-3-glycerol phosphate synthase
MTTSMMSILDEIVLEKRRELEDLPMFEILMENVRRNSLPETKGFMRKIRNSQGPVLIAEIKKSSPSKGIIRENFHHLQIARDYEAGGAHCFSVLTDKKFFQGDIDHLADISSLSSIPVLRKDFIIEKRQVLEARLAGADAVLLIAAILDDVKLEKLFSLSIDLGMDVLVEVHDEEEMERVLVLPFKMIGINNRNLKTFEVDLETTKKLLKKYKTALANKVVVTESGISTRSQIEELYTLGVKAFLVGESLMCQSDIQAAVKALL